MLRRQRPPGHAGSITLDAQRTPFFKATAKALARNGGLSLIVALVLKINLFPAALPSPSGVLLGLGAYAAMIAFGLPHWRRLVLSRAPVSQCHMPVGREEDVWWGIVSLTAGVCEEITWRGVQVTLLAAIIGYWPAAMICALTFGVGHLSQGRTWAFTVVAFALTFHALVWLTGSLYVAMAVHAAVDFTAGLYTARIARLSGYGVPPEQRTPAPGVALDIEPSGAAVALLRLSA